MIDNDLLKSLFLRARDQYEGAARWSFLVVLVFLVFHLMTFSQFIRLEKQLSSTEAELARLTSLEETVTDLAPALEQLEGRIVRPLESQLGDLLTGLKSDFEALDRAVAQASTPATTRFTDSSADFLLEDEPPSGMAVQMESPDAPRMEGVFELDEELKQQIRNVRDSEELRELLRPVIEEQIVRPRFDQLNSYWRDEVLPDVRQQGDSILIELQKNEPLFPERDLLWEDVQSGIEETVTVAVTLEFQPPTDDPNWWASVAGKAATLSDISEAVTDQLTVAGGFAAVEELQEQVKTALIQQEKLQATLQEELTQVKESFDQQQARLATLGKPFDVLSLDINFVVTQYPLLLGIVLAATSIWPAYRLRELAWMVDLMAKRGQGRAPWEWFFVRTQLSLPRPQAVESTEGVHRSAWQENWSWKFGVLGRGLVYWGWIGIAAWQLVRLGNVEPLRVATLAAGGFLAVAAAQGYHWYVARRVLALSQAVLQPVEIHLDAGEPA